ncbi:MAG: hypothetical protein NC041_01295 [Bacteroides sp.]|nr:hypothetical protein [Prevotella sp.]MCM1407763.1 hypothetical protein [Treponema brennaborense]MCM1469087.1 hypothetical protein [Bacteroides sp.]
MKKTTRIAALSAAAALIFGGLFCSCIDSEPDSVVENVDISGVWTYTEGGKTSYFYAENGILYAAVKNNGKYVYSKGDRYIYATYTVIGNTVAMTMDGEEYACTVKDNTLTHNAGKIMLTKVEDAATTCIDVDITGVWTYTQDGATLYVYADETTVYDAAKIGDSYKYSTRYTAVWGTYTVIGNTVIMNMEGKECPGTVSGDLFTLNVGGAAGEIRLTKVEGAAAACDAMDADITGVWSYTENGVVSYIYADETTVYDAVKIEDSYKYSTTNTAVWGVYAVIGDTVIVTVGGKEYTGTVSGDSFVLTVGGTIGNITLTKVEGAAATCDAIDADITGVWTYTQDGKTSYVYADDNTIYTAVKGESMYVYSKANAAVWGVYTGINDTVTMAIAQLGGRKYTCTISGDSFTLNIGGSVGNITLTKVKDAAAACIDVDITGVWNGTAGESPVCIYAEGGILYAAAESNGIYVYSRANAAVWGVYTIIGNNVIMAIAAMRGEEYTCTVKDNMLTSSADEIIEITLEKAEGAVATCVVIEN